MFFRTTRKKKKISEKNVLLSFQDDLIFQKYVFLKQHLDALQFILYNEELEVCNTLASKTGIQKLGMFYVIFGNVSPKYRSTLKMIHLVAVKVCIVTWYGSNFGTNNLRFKFIWKEIGSTKWKYNFWWADCPYWW